MKGSWRVELLEEAGARPAEAPARVCQEERLLHVEEAVALGREGSAQVHLVLDQVALHCEGTLLVRVHGDVKGSGQVEWVVRRDEDPVVARVLRAPCVQVRLESWLRRAVAHEQIGITRAGRLLECHQQPDGHDTLGHDDLVEAVLRVLRRPDLAHHRLARLEVQRRLRPEARRQLLQLGALD